MKKQDRNRCEGNNLRHNLRDAAPGGLRCETARLWGRVTSTQPCVPIGLRDGRSRNTLKPCAVEAAGNIRLQTLRLTEIEQKTCVDKFRQSRTIILLLFQCLTADEAAPPVPL